VLIETTMEHLIRDTKYALRSLSRSPVLAGVIILSLGIGIGINTVIFSWIQAIVFRPLPGVRDAAALHMIEAYTDTGARPGASWLEYRDLQERVQSLAGLIAYRMAPLSVGEASRTERTYALLVSGNYFSSLAIEPAAGRFFRPEEAARPGSDPVTVISYDYWQTRFGGAASAIGQTLRANGRDLTVIGVTPDGFQGTMLGLQFDLWVPATLAPALLAGSRELEDRSLRGYSVMGRLRPDTTVEQARAEVAAGMARLAEAYPATNKAVGAEVLTFWRALRGPPSMLFQGLGILQGVMLLLLLAVCGNTANLVLARASARQREFGVRLAVGAGTGRIVRQLLVENLLLGLVASVIGVLIAVWGTQALRALPLSTAFPVKFQTSIDAAGLAFASLLGIVCALGFGAAPAIHLARVDPQSVLRSGSSGAVSLGLRRAVMAAQVALAIAVLVSAGLFLRSFTETSDDPGFQREGVLLAAYDLSGRGMDGDASRDFARRLLDRLHGDPDVQAAAIATSVPLDIHGMPARSFTLEGRARTDGAPDQAISNTVTPDYFDVMRIPMLSGDGLVELSDTTTAPQVVVNEAFVQRFIGEGEVIGRRLQNGNRTYAIAGVVRNSLYESFGEPPKPIIYFSYRDRPSGAGEVHVRARGGDEGQLSSAVRRAVQDLDASLPIYNVRSMTQHVETNLTLRRIPARMFVVLGPLLLLLAAVGIYAVVAYTVAHRTVEIGVRIALGATARRVVRQIVVDSLRVVAAGAAFGWLLVLMLYTHLVRGAIDVPSFAGVPALLLGVAALAAWIPARRATAVDPMTSLRHD
jgi:predicted permease